MEYRIEYSDHAVKHLRSLKKWQQTLILDEVPKYLKHEPLVETRNRKPMRQNPLAPWELRIGSLRIFYDAEPKPEPTVFIRAVGIKVGNQVKIGKEVLTL